MKLRRPSPALLISCLALFISLGGVSYGVATGFIDSRELKNNTIRTQDLRNNDIRGRDIRNSTIAGRDVAFNTLTGSDISETRLSTVPNADKVDGIEASGLVKTDTVGFVPLVLGTGSTEDPGEAAPAFDLDTLGYVHLRGSLLTNGAPAFDPSGGCASGDRRAISWRVTTAPRTVASGHRHQRRRRGHRRWTRLVRRDHLQGRRLDPVRIRPRSRGSALLSRE